jgi:hypothetical protein
LCIAVVNRDAECFEEPLGGERLQGWPSRSWFGRLTAADQRYQKSGLPQASPLITEEF